MYVIHVHNIKHMSDQRMPWMGIIYSKLDKTNTLPRGLYYTLNCCTTLICPKALSTFSSQYNLCHVYLIYVDSYVWLSVCVCLVCSLLLWSGKGVETNDDGYCGPHAIHVHWIDREYPRDHLINTLIRNTLGVDVNGCLLIYGPYMDQGMNVWYISCLNHI